MCPQAPRLSPEYSHKAGLQTVITGRPLQIRPVMRSGHAGPVTMGRFTRGPPRWTRSQDETTSSQVFVRRRVRRRVSLPVVLPPLVQRGRRRHRAKGGVFAFAPTFNDGDNESNLSIFRGQLRSASGSTTKTLTHEEWRHIMLYVLTNLEEVTPYMEQFLHEFWRRSRDPTPQEYDTLLRKGARNGLPDFISWFKRKVRA
jgi:hypothetical protein